MITKKVIKNAKKFFRDKTQNFSTQSRLIDQNLVSAKYDDIYISINEKVKTTLKKRKKMKKLVQRENLNTQIQS